MKPLPDVLLLALALGLVERADHAGEDHRGADKWRAVYLSHHVHQQHGLYVIDRTFYTFELRPCMGELVRRVDRLGWWPDILAERPYLGAPLAELRTLTGAL